MKKMLFFKFAFIIFTLLFLFNFKNIYASTYDIEQYNINANILKSGDVHVEEYIKYRFTEQVNGVYRDILYNYKYANQKNDINPTSSRYQASDVNAVLVYVSDKNFSDMQLYTLYDESKLKNGDSEKYSVQALKQNGYRKMIKVYMNDVKSGDIKYVKYVYDIKDACVKYNDASELYWNFVGANWDNYIYNLNINIYFGSNINKDKIKVYPHSYATLKTINMYTDRIEMFYPKVGSNTAVDARVVMPKEAASDSVKIVNQNYDFTKLTNLENKLQKQKKFHFIAVYIAIFATIYVFISLVITVMISIIKTLKNKKSINKVDYYRDIPDQFNLEESAVIFNGYNSINSSNLIISVLLELSNDKYILLEAKKKNKSSNFSAKYDYNMKLNFEKDFSKLPEYYLYILNLLFNDKFEKQINVNEFKYKEIELNSRLKELRPYKIKGYRNYTKFIEKENKDTKKRFYKKDSRSLIKYTKISTVIYFILLMFSIISSIMSGGINGEYIFSLLFITAFYALITFAIAKNTYYLKDEYANHYDKLLGLKKYLKDYSLIKDRYPIEIKLWEKYMVYATLFSISKKVIKEFKSDLIAKGFDEEKIYNSYPVIGFSENIISISNSIATSTGSYGSGGYTSGGAGGGRRWWWPEVAHFKNKEKVLHLEKNLIYRQNY